MKRFISMLLVVVIIATLTATMPNVVSAGNINGGYVRIQGVQSKKYFDIPSEKWSQNGAQLQIWDYVIGNENQIFKLEEVGNGAYKIYVGYGKDKIVEVRDSSHEDYAQVAQWSNHNSRCGLWYIQDNGDGTVSFKNVESGKYINVYGNQTQNGATLIQYYWDDTTAEKFVLHYLGINEVWNATWSRKLHNNELKWNEYPNGHPVKNPGISNRSGLEWGYGDYWYYPQPQQFVKSVTYLDPGTVGKMIDAEAYAKNYMTEIGKAIAGELSDQAISALLEKFGIKIPGIGTMISILSVLAKANKAEEWNRFCDAGKADDYGQHSGVIVTTYTNVAYRYRQEPITSKNVVVIETYETHSYKKWTGSNFSDVYQYAEKQGQDGEWVLHLK